MESSIADMRSTIEKIEVALNNAELSPSLFSAMREATEKCISNANTILSSANEKPENVSVQSRSKEIDNLLQRATQLNRQIQTKKEAWDQFCEEEATGNHLLNQIRSEKPTMQLQSLEAVREKLRIFRVLQMKIHLNIHIYKNKIYSSNRQ